MLFAYLHYLLRLGRGGPKRVALKEAKDPLKGTSSLKSNISQKALKCIKHKIFGSQNYSSNRANFFSAFKIGLHGKLELPASVVLLGAQGTLG